MNSTLLLGFDEQTQSVHEVPITNTLFLGDVGSGKIHFMAENIKHQESANMIVLDTGNRLFDNTCDTLLQKGYTVLNYDFMKDSEVDGLYNPFEYMDSDASIIDTADIISSMLNVENNPLWGSVVNRILIEYLMNYKEKYDLPLLTMHKLYEAVVSGNIKNSFSEDILADSVEGKILSEFAERLKPYADMDTPQSLFDLSKFFTENKQVLFLEMYITTQTPNLIYVIMLNQLIKRMTDCERKPELIFFLSEAGTFPVELIPNFGKMVSAADKYKSAFVLDAQSVNQLSPLVLDVMKLIVFCGCFGYANAEYLSNRCGFKAVTGLEFAHIGKFPIPLPRLSKKKKYIVEPAELFRLGDECVVLSSENKHVRLKKLPLPS